MDGSLICWVWQAVEVHEDVGHHVHGHVVHLPRLLDAPEEGFAGGTALVGRGAGHLVERDGHEALGDQLEDDGHDLVV